MQFELRHGFAHFQHRQRRQRIKPQRAAGIKPGDSRPRRMDDLLPQRLYHRPPPARAESVGAP